MNKAPVFFNLVKEDLTLVEILMRSQSEGSHQDVKNALDILISSGGKRIRPTVTLLVGRMLKAPHESLLNMAAAIEMLHTATLVHDDLIDGSLLRRGMPTLNSQWSAGATILTGDFIFAKAAELAGKTNSVEVIKLFASTLGEIVNGEITQMFSSHCIPDRESYFKRIYAKTASLFRTSARSAAIISASKEEMVNCMTAYGYHIGMAFQIVDDILDFTSEENTIGKPVGTDLKQGLVTLPVLEFIEKFPDDPDAKLILKGKCLENEHRISQFIKTVCSSGIIEMSIKKAQEHIQHAIRAIHCHPFTQERQALEELALFITQRDI